MTILAGGAVIYRPGRGFLLLRNRDYWEFPKGRVDSSDEGIKSTALREVREETGLTDLKMVEGFHEKERYRVKRGPKEVDYFLCLTEQEPTISSEHWGYCWCTASEVPRFLSYESKRKIFRKAVAVLRRKGFALEVDLGSPRKRARPSNS